jgi:hypothetical protein
MEYGEWIRNEHDRGVDPEAIAQAALHGPILSFEGSTRTAALLEEVAAVLRVASEAIHVVGSARFGFCLRDGARFAPTYSDLDLAIVDNDLYARCGGAPQQVLGAARFPERDLPFKERASVRQAFDVLSRTVKDRYAYVSAAVFPDHAALVRAQAGRIRAYLGITTQESTILRTAAGPGGALDADFQRAVDAGLPRFSLPIAESSPGNASPWMVDNAAFQRAFGGNALRRGRLSALQQAFGDLAQVVDVQCCLVGGSFVDVANAAPNDLDIVVFYRARTEVRFEPGRALQRLTRKFLLDHIDMRFVPCDAEPWLLVKLTSYFTMLYQSRRPGTDDRNHGLVLLVPGSGPS